MQHGDKEKVASIEDEKFMQRCIQLAKCGDRTAPPNPMVGAVVVYQGKIIGEGYHQRCGEAHAEVNAIGRVKDRDLLTKSTLYVSLEPCAHYGKTPPCADLIISCQIPRVVVGCTDPFAKVNGLGIKKMRDAGIHVTVGVLEQECRRLNQRFFTFHQARRPWITLKWAQSADGFIAQADGTPVIFSTPFTTQLVHRLRTHYQAIMVGTRTVLTDNPALTVREWTGTSPLRITRDRRGVIPDTARILDPSAPTLLYRHENVAEILDDLYQRGVQSLLVEGGASLHQQFIQEGLWDEARIEVSPMFLGKGVPAASLKDALLVEERNYGQNRISLYCPI